MTINLDSEPWERPERFIALQHKTPALPLVISPKIGS
jgi:hypothetical protein